jgi:AcrR family transcriptional regulator
MSRDGAQHVVELQRSRLLHAIVSVVDECGYAESSVARITARARVSRRTFYELFDNREEALVAVLDSAVDLVSTEPAMRELEGVSWREHVRTGLWVLLSLIEREPTLARVCVVEAMSGGPLVLQRRAEIIARLVDIVDDGRATGSSGARCTRVTAEGVVGAALAIVHGRLWRREQASFTDLFDELLGLILLPYVGAAVTRRERTRAVPAPLADSGPGESHEAPLADDALRDLPMRLTYRTSLVLAAIAEHPGISNRRLGEYAEIHDQGQVSKLLGRLGRLGLLSNGGAGHLTGAPNAWTLTDKGAQVASLIGAHERVFTNDAANGRK